MKKRLTVSAKALIVVVAALVLWMFFLLFAPASAPAAELHGELEAGYDLSSDLWEFSTELDLSQPVWKLTPHLYAGWYTLTEKESLTNWLPWVQTYKVGFGVWIGEHVNVSYTHYCMHPVDLRRRLLFDYEDFVMQAENRISVKYTW